MNTIRKVYVKSAIALVLGLAFTLPVRGQFLTSPQPGDVYKEFSRVMSAGSGDTWRVNDPNVNLTTYPAAAAFLPNPTLNLTVDDLAGAIRAEAVISIWGGHISTTGKQVRFNGNAFLNIPEMGTGNGLPPGSQGYNYLQQLNVTIPVPLAHLVTGTNTFQGTNSGQVPGPTGYGFDWGQHGWYALMIRIYYDGTKAHPSGSIASPTTGSTFGENPTVSANVSAGVNRVDFIAYYNGYDTDGDGIYQEYHFDYQIGLNETEMNIKNHVGTATSAPWQAPWNTQWVPDQAAGSVKLVARIRDNNGVWFVTPVSDNLTFQRIGSSVKLYKPANTPERAWARGDLPPVVITTVIPGGDNIATATAAAVHLRTWNGLDAARDPGETHYRRYNTFEDTDFGFSHYYSYDVRSVPVANLIQGTNSFSFFSQTVAHHGIEILWPGPALMVRYTSASNVPPSITQQPSDQTTTVGQTATFTVGATGSQPLSYQWQKNNVNIGGANASSYTTPVTVLGDNGSTFRCVVTNSINTATSNNATLTVNAAPPPPPSSIVSDDFNSAALNTSLWTFTNPVGDVALTMTGTGTADARVSLAIPAGVSHDLWTGTNFAPRITQGLNNSDFEVEAKFETPLTAQYQMQGIVAQQDNNTFVRFDFVRDASATRFFCASFSAGSPTIRKDTALASGNPLYLRVKRQGTTWTGSFSYNGSTWITATTFSYALTVNTVGPYAGNHGIPANTSPAFTALIDYFFNTASPINPEDGASGPVAPSITQQPANQTVTVGQTATFTVAASGTTPFTYQWQKNSVNIGGANASSYTTPATVLGDNGSTFRCMVTNSVNTATSNPATLTVNSAPPPSGLVSDDFSAPALNTSLWTFVNPVGDAVASITGTGTQDARLSISIPAGVSHDLWTGTNFAPRMLQAFNNGDFEAEVKFESPLTAQYQMLGIVAQQDNNTFVRFDFVRDASATRFFCASFSAGSPTIRKDTALAAGNPLYLRVKRQGSTWTGSFSYNGSTWITATTFSYALTVNTVGPFVGTHGIPASSSPAFTGLIDYFFNTASPINPEDGASGPVAPSITQQPANQTVTVGQTATFTVAASGTTPFTYQWQKNSVNIGGANASSYTTPATVLGDNGSTFRCMVTNSVNTATSNPATLTVNSAPPPSGLVSDDFSAPALNTSLWTFVNPVGDAVASITGTGTQDARLSISIPAGVSHDLWTGTNFAPRMLQAFNNGDFEAEVKFESPLTAQYQMLGIVAQQDNNTFVRFDFVRDASATRFFCASFSAGSPTIRKDTALAAGNPLYLRVKRQGSTWTGSFSYNGSTWITATTFSYALTVNTVGPFVGTHGIPASSSPAFTGLIDYFFNTASPINPEDGASGPVAPSITQQPANQTVTVGQTATFTVAASGTTPFTYQWQKNSVNIGGANASSYTTPVTVLGDNGSTFRCMVTNSVNTATSNPATLTVNSAPPPPPGWWNTAWRYRVPVNVDPAGFQRSARPADVTLNFTQLLTTLGAAGSFNENSLRVIEVTSTGSLIDSTITFQFDKDPAYNAASNALGTLVFMLNGTTASGALRYFHVYFETATGFTASTFASQVTVTDNVVDEGQSGFRVATQGASYYYHKQGAGFSSILDLNGNDWLNYHVGGGSAGEYRGIPNLGVWGHPGYTNATSSLSYSGPLKATVASQTTDGLWKLIWEFYPRFARMTLKQAGGSYWMLYEGTPGGTYNPATGFWVRSSGQRLTDNTLFVGEIASPEWVYFGDQAIPRFLFLAHHEDDNLEDQYWNMENNMTVFGFGRQYASTTALMTAVPAHLTIGFGEDTLQAVTTINSAFRDLSVIPGTPEINGGSPPPPPAGIVSDNFNSGSLNTSLWSFINPLGDASVSMSGTQARISIPAGTTHDLWTGLNTVPRLMQAAPNSDFEVEAKFDAAMTSEYQTQGIMAAENTQNFIRFDFVRDATKTRFFAASFAGGTPTIRKDTAITSGSPLYLRMKRTGTTWTGSFSYNGTTWFTGVTFSNALTVTSAGPFAGNAGSAPPAFVALIDYFFNTASPQLPATALAGNKETVEDAPQLPTEFMLGSNYPNPFNPTTTIGYALPEPALVSLKVYSMLGQEIATLAAGTQSAGEYRVVWNGRNMSGNPLSSGVYLYRFSATGISGKTFLLSRRMILMK